MAEQTAQRVKFLLNPNYQYYIVIGSSSKNQICGQVI